EAQLVSGVRCVGNELAQEDFLVAVQGMDHQMKQLLGFGLKAQGGFFRCRHGCPSLLLLWEASAPGLGGFRSPRDVRKMGAAPQLSRGEKKRTRRCVFFLRAAACLFQLMK